MKRLTIGICTITSRSHLLARLMTGLQPQLTSAVELIIEHDDTQQSIGRKRQTILDKATATHLAYIDDDDIISPKYVSRILAALESDPDCVGMLVERTIKGAPWGIATHSMRFDANVNTIVNGQPQWQRWINHLCPVRTTIAREAGGFDDRDEGEDTDYAARIRPLLTSEVFIDEPLYTYLYVPQDERQERTHAHG